MAKRDSFLLRVDPEVLDALRRWANDELRSVNGQVEYLLRRALKDAGRLSDPPVRTTRSETSPPSSRRTGRTKSKGGPKP